MTALIAYLKGHAVWAESFRHRDFRYLFASATAGMSGRGMEMVTVGWLMLEMTDSTFMVGVVSAARMAPFFFLGIPAGAVADRVNRRILSRIIMLASGSVAGITAVLLLGGVARPWHIIALSVASGCTWAFQQTVNLSYTYDIVGQRRALNGLALMSLGRNAGTVAGALVAGATVASVGPGSGYVVVTVSYAAALALLLPMREAGQAAPTQRDSVLQNLTGAISLIRRNRILAILLCLTSLTEILGYSHQTLLPVLARDVLGVGALGLGVITAVRRLGGSFALLTLAVLGESLPKGKTMLIGVFSFGLGLIALAGASNLYTFLVIVALINASAMLGDTVVKTIMQDNVPNEERGQAMGFWVLGLGTGPIGHLSVGGMASGFGAPITLLIAGGILATVGLVAATASNLRRIP